MVQHGASQSKVVSQHSSVGEESSQNCRISTAEDEQLKNFMTNKISQDREISIQGEGYGTACAAVNQLFSRLFFN